MKLKWWQFTCDTWRNHVQCPAVLGHQGNLVAAEAAAEDAGWVVRGKLAYCPVHAPRPHESDREAWLRLDAQGALPG